MDPTLKQRLVGTAVLVALAVIFVPMLLDGPVDPVNERRVTGVPLELPEPLPVPEAQPMSRGNEAPVTDTPAPPVTNSDSAPGFAVQLGAFRDETAAAALVARLRSRNFDAFVMSGEGWHRVRVGPLPERDAAVALAERIHRAIGEPTQVVTHP
jgi:DedD protein